MISLYLRYCAAVTSLFIAVTFLIGTANGATWSCGDTQVIPDLYNGAFDDEGEILYELRLDGEIQSGDTKRLEEAIHNCTDSRDQNGRLSIKRAVLNSPGGNLLEAVKLGTYFFENNIGTLVEEKCLSACAVSFMGGRRGGDYGNRSESITWRQMMPSAHLGFHAPFLPNGLEIPVTTTTGNRLLGIGHDAALEAAAQLLVYSAQVNWPVDLMQEMLSTPASEMLLVETVGQLRSWKIDVVAPNDRIFFSDSELSQACVFYKQLGWMNSPSEDYPLEVVSDGGDLIARFGESWWTCEIAIYGELYQPYDGFIVERLTNYTNLHAAMTPVDTKIADLPTIWAGRQSVLENIPVGRSAWRSDGLSLSLDYDTSYLLHQIELSLAEVGSVALPTGATVGTVVFRGLVYGSHVAGTAWQFDERCGAVPYNVSGRISEDGRRIDLVGRQPVLDSLCLDDWRLRDNEDSKIFFEHAKTE